MPSTRATCCSSTPAAQMTVTGHDEYDDWNRHWVEKIPGDPVSTFGRYTGHCRRFAATRLKRPLEKIGFEDVTVFREGFSFSDLYRPVVIARGKRRLADVKQSKSRLVSGKSGTALGFLWRNMNPSSFGRPLLAGARRSEDSAL
jgi:hypothetical protein